MKEIQKKKHTTWAFPCFPYAASHPICMRRRGWVDWGQPLLLKICWRVFMMSDVSKSHQCHIGVTKLKYNIVLIIYFIYFDNKTSWLFTHYKKVRFEVQTKFELLNLVQTQKDWTLWSSLTIYLNFGLNFGSEPNCGIPKQSTVMIIPDQQRTWSYGPLLCMAYTSPFSLFSCVQCRVNVLIFLQCRSRFYP